MGGGGRGGVKIRKASKLNINVREPINKKETFEEGGGAGGCGVTAQTL